MQAGTLPLLWYSQKEGDNWNNHVHGFYGHNDDGAKETSGKDSHNLQLKDGRGLGLGVAIEPLRF